MKQYLVPVLLVVNASNEDQAAWQAEEFLLASVFEFRKIYDIHDYKVNTQDTKERE